MKHIYTLISYAIIVLVVAFFIDFAGLALWIASGQHPVDEFYIGTVSAHLFKWYFTIGSWTMNQ